MLKLIWKSESKPLSKKKKVCFGVLIFLCLTLPLVPMDYIGDPLWSSYAVGIIFALIYVKWFMKD